MPKNSPIFTKNLYLIITLVVIVAGFLGASPMLIGKLNQQGMLIVTSQVPESNATAEMPLTPAQAVATIPGPQVTESNVTAGVTTTPAQTPPVIQSPQLSYKYIFVIAFRSHEFVLQNKTPVYLANFAHPEVGCSWSGVAGQVFGKDGTPINGKIVTISGTINGKAITLDGVTSGAPAYGQGGYEIKITDAPFASSGLLTIILNDENHHGLSKPVSLTTYQDCNKNLIIINFSPLK